jgi:hypothetical protein
LRERGEVVLEGEDCVVNSLLRGGWKITNCKNKLFLLVDFIANQPVLIFIESGQLIFVGFEK